MHVLPFIIGIGVLSYIIWIYIIHPTFLSPLSKLPNAHFSTPFNPLWILWKRHTERENRTIHAAHQKHGKIVRLGPNEVSINCVDDGIRIVYSGGFEKAEWYPNQFDNFSVPCMFSMARSKPHSVRKRMLSNIYSKSYLQSSSTFQKLSQSLVYNKLLPLIDSFAVKNDAIDILELNFSSTMDFVSAFIFGLGNGSDFLSAPQARQRWLETYQSRRPFRFWDSELPYVKTLTKNLGYPVVPPWVAEATATIENWVMERCQASKTWTGLISQRSDTTETTPAIVFDQLTKSVAAKTADDPALGSPELQVASELQDHLAAGHETSGITLTYLYWELSRNPALQVSLRNELLKLSPPITLGPSNNQPGQDLPDPRAIDALPLLHAVLMETLRIHAAIPGSQPRVTPYPPISVAGSPPLPSGTRISTQAYSLHRNADVFPDPEVWNPARWLNSSEEKRTEMSKWFWAFGSGGRMCVGRNLAMQEMKLITAAIYTNFTTHIEDDTGIEQVDAYTAGPKANKLMLRFKYVGL